MVIVTIYSQYISLFQDRIGLRYAVQHGRYHIFSERGALFGTGIAIVNRRLFKQLFPFPFLAHRASYTQLLNGVCLYYTIPQYT